MTELKLKPLQMGPGFNSEDPHPSAFQFSLMAAWLCVGWDALDKLSWLYLLRYVLLANQ